MADLQKTVKIIFEGEDKSVANFAQNLSGKFEDLNYITGKVTEPLSKVADAVMKIDTALAALAIGGMALALKSSSDFNQGFALISTSVDATGKDLANYRQSILDYSTTSVKSISDINNSLYTAAQAGIKWGDSLEFMGKVEQLSVANNANLNTTVDLLTGTMNAYGFTIKDVGHLNDVFFQSTLIGKQTIDTLGQSMGQVVGLAANFGVSFEALSAAIATLTAKGMETSEAITAVKGVITTFVSPSKEAAEAAKALGVDFSATSLKARGLQQMLADVMKATGGNADKMAVLFNEVRALNGVMQMTGDGMKFFNDALQQIKNSTGAAEEAYKKMVGTFKNQCQMLINSAQTLLIDVGTSLEPIAAKVSGSFGQLLKGIKIGVDTGAFAPLFKYLQEAGAELAAWVTGVAKALPDALKGLDFSKLISSLKDLGGAFGEYLGDLDLTDVQDLHEFIQKLIDGIAGLVRITEGMVEGFRPFFVAIKDFLMGIADSDVEAQKMVGTVLALCKAVETFGLGLVAVAKIVEETGTSISGTFNIVAGGAQVMFNGLQMLMNGVEMAIVLIEKVVLGLLNTLGLSRFSETFRNIQATIEETGMSIRESFIQNGMDASRGLERIGDGLSSFANQSDTAAKSAKDTGKSIANNLGNSAAAATVQVSDLGREVNNLPAKKETAISVSANSASLKDTEKAINDKFNSAKNVQITTSLDGTTTIECINKIGSSIPAEKKLEVKPDITQTALAEIKEKAEIVQKSIEWKAKVDIAQIESATKTVEAAFKSVDNTITDTGKTLDSLMGTYADLMKSGKGTAFMEQMIEDENKRRDQALEIQKSLTEAQIENMKARTQAIQSGQAMISIDGKGLQPHLEAFMFEILKSIQVRANAEGAQFLVGI